MSVSTATADQDQVASPGETCPRCHTTRSWGENSWCPDCGYYPIVDSGAPEGSSWADDLPEVVQEAEDNRTALESIPVWFWGMIAGIVGVTGFSVVIRLLFPGEDGETVRGTIALIQLSAGLISMVVAHIIATRFAMANDRRINLFDFVISWFSIWQPTIIALPNTCRRLLAVVWGAIAFLTAITIIGGIDYGAAFRPAHAAPKLKPMSVIGAVAGAARAKAAKDENKPESMEEALDDLASQVEEMGGELGSGADMSIQEAFDELGDMEGSLDKLTSGLPSDLKVPDALKNLSPQELAQKLQEAAAKNRPNLNCFVYGVITDERNVPASFLLAANTKGVDQHIAEIHGKDMSKADFKRMVMKLYKAVQKNPEIASERTAIWVKPIVTCRLSFKKLNENGEMEDAKFEAFVIEQRGRFDTSRNPRGKQTQRR